MTNISLSDTLEIDLLRSMIVVVTVAFSSLSFFIDGNPYLHGFSLWMYFIALSPIIFIFTLSLRSHPKINQTLLAVLLIGFAVALRQYDVTNNGGFISGKFIFIGLHFIAMNFFFYKAVSTLVLDDVKADLSMFHKNKSKSSSSRKLTRRRNRRAHSRAKNTVKIKSGQYRG